MHYCLFKKPNKTFCFVRVRKNKTTGATMLRCSKIKAVSEINMIYVIFVLKKLTSLYPQAHVYPIIPN